MTSTPFSTWLSGPLTTGMGPNSFKIATAVCVAGLLSATSAAALPGTHVPAISTFDTRASSVVLAYRGGLAGDTTSRMFSYSANFAATSGNFIAQFGAHYLQLRDVPDAPLAHGAGASGVGLFSIPLAKRYPSGLPEAALDLYLGVAPAVAISGERNFLTAPFVLGLGVSWSVAGAITLTPWLEAAPSANLDTFINTESISIEPTVEVTESGEVAVGQPDVASAVNQAVDTQFFGAVATRAGLAAQVHLSESWDLRFNSFLGSLGSVFGGVKVVHLGGALVLRWDEVVPAVLPASKRLSAESCEAVTARFAQCPQAKRWGQPSPTMSPVAGPLGGAAATVKPTPVEMKPSAPAPAVQGAPPPGAPPSAAQPLRGPVAPRPQQTLPVAPPPPAPAPASAPVPAPPPAAAPMPPPPTGDFSQARPPPGR